MPSGQQDIDLTTFSYYRARPVKQSDPGMWMSIDGSGVATSTAPLPAGYYRVVMFLDVVPGGGVLFSAWNATVVLPTSLHPPVPTARVIGQNEIIVTDGTEPLSLKLTGGAGNTGDFGLIQLVEDVPMASGQQIIDVATFNYFRNRPIKQTDPGMRMSIADEGPAVSTGLIPAGTYRVRVNQTGGVCFINWGNTITVPADGVPPVLSPPSAKPVGDGELVVTDGTKKLSAQLSGSFGNTGDLALDLLVE